MRLSAVAKLSTPAADRRAPAQRYAPARPLHLRSQSVTAAARRAASAGLHQWALSVRAESSAAPDGYGQGAPLEAEGPVLEELLQALNSHRRRAGEFGAAAVQALQKAYPVLSRLPGCATLASALERVCYSAHAVLRHQAPEGSLAAALQLAPLLEDLAAALADAQEELVPAPACLQQLPEAGGAWKPTSCPHSSLAACLEHRLAQLYEAAYKKACSRIRNLQSGPEAAQEAGSSGAAAIKEALSGLQAILDRLAAATSAAVVAGERQLAGWDPCCELSAGWVYAGILGQQVKVLEKAKQWQKARDLLHQLLDVSTGLQGWGERRGTWWDRLYVIYDAHLQQKDLARQVAASARADPTLGEADRRKAARREAGLSDREWAEQHEAEQPAIPEVVVRAVRAPKDKRRGQPLWKGANSRAVTVTTRVVQHYESLGFKVAQTAGVWLMLYHLLLWDPDHSTRGQPWCRFHNGAWRKHFEARLARIRSGQAVQMLAEGLVSLATSKRSTNVTLQDVVRAFPMLSELVVCMGDDKLAAWVEQMEQDPHNMREGLPHLIILKPGKQGKQGKQGSVQLLAVKSPGAKLSDQLRVCLRQLLRAGLACEIVRVKPRQPAQPQKQAKS